MKTYLYPLFVSLIILSACGGEPAENSTAEVEDIGTSKEMEEEINPMKDFKFQSMIANLPSPLETFNTAQGLDLEVPKDMLTPTKKAENLSTMTQKCYAYGIYLTDMAVLAFENDNQGALDYLNICRDLSEDLGASEVFNRTILSQFQENATDQEQFVKMLDGSIGAMDEYMQNNERFLNATEIYMGTWVESQLLATQLLNGNGYSEETKAIYEGIYMQKLHTSNLVNLLSEMDAEINKDVYKSVEAIMMFYAGFTDAQSIGAEDLSELSAMLNALKTQLLA